MTRPARPPGTATAPGRKLSNDDRGRSRSQATIGLAVLLLLVGACRRAPDAASETAPKTAAAARTTSADCRECHEDLYKAWADSHHAHAHRPVMAAQDQPTFTTAGKISLHGTDYDLGWENNHPTITETRPGAQPEKFAVEHVLGYTPLQQFVVPVGGGRYQMTELAYDPAKKDWFNVFGDERRRLGEWGHWRGRGMNWNSMCAHCHFTEFKKNYDPASDTYASSWREPGVGCYQCHSDLPADHIAAKRKAGAPGVPPAPKPPVEIAPERLAAMRARQQESCGPCHARNELLSGELTPGARYAEHYRLTLPVDPAVFYPDGQVRDEDFNLTSLLTSRMGGKAGITCLDCHEPHTGKTRLPAANNALCMQCHAAPGRQNAPVIEPVLHSFHKADSTGNQCVTCHMPLTTYMQRDPRHDHGFLKPDPLLTKELGIPNACNRCHTDKSVDWAIEAADKWYGAKMESRQRQRTRAVAAVQREEPGAAAKLLEFLANEDVPAWRASMLTLLRSHALREPGVAEAARRAAGDPDPMVRSAAVQLLGTLGDRAAITPALKDEARLVRLDAAWSLSEQLADGTPERKELEAYLRSAADQPAGRVRMAQDLANRGQPAAAETHARIAAQWDPNSSGVQETLGFILNATGKPAEAAGSLWRAAQLNPVDAQASFNAALAFAEAGKIADAELALRETTKRAPRHDRAWYNLGLLLNQTGRVPDAIQALQHAESLAPQNADYPYARATILWRLGERPAALAAAQRALQINPGHEGARGLLQQAR